MFGSWYFVAPLARTWSILHGIGRKREEWGTRVRREAAYPAHRSGGNETDELSCRTVLICQTRPQSTVLAVVFGPVPEREPHSTCSVNNLHLP